MTCPYHHRADDCTTAGHCPGVMVDGFTGDLQRCDDCAIWDCDAEAVAHVQGCADCAAYVGRALWAAFSSPAALGRVWAQHQAPAPIANAGHL